MTSKKITISSKLHSRNKHIDGYDFQTLIQCWPSLKDFVIISIKGRETIDFANPTAVNTLNTALLMAYYKVNHWSIPDGYLCPPIPGRADYIHHVADLQSDSNGGTIPKGTNVHILDIGVGANCIYPLIGQHEYGWSFVGSDIDKVALDNARKIISDNQLDDKVKIREQLDRNQYFENIILKDEKYHAVICNPPFHSSIQEALESNIRKVHNLSEGKVTDPQLNFGGQNTELWTRGGEVKFVRRMIVESKNYQKNVLWFTSIISKSDHLKSIYQEFDLQGIKTYKTIEMSQGNKISRFVAWTFVPLMDHKRWLGK